MRVRPTASKELVAAKQRMEGLAVELIEGGQRRREVGDGPADVITVPLTASLQTSPPLP